MIIELCETTSKKTGKHYYYANFSTVWKRISYGLFLRAECSSTRTDTMRTVVKNDFIHQYKTCHGVRL